jgi:hypothetical protein
LPVLALPVLACVTGCLCNWLPVYYDYYYYYYFYYYYYYYY